MGLTMLAQELTDRAYEGMTSVEVAAALNARTLPGPVPRLELKDAAIMRGAWARLVRASETDDETGNLALNIMAAFAHDGPPVNLQRPEVRTMLSGAVAAGLFTEEDREAFEGLATVHARSWADDHWTGPVREADVIEARNG